MQDNDKNQSLQFLIK